MKRDAVRDLLRDPTTHREELKAAYRALAGPRGATLDPGSITKEAILEALDQIEDFDVDLFADAASYQQPERARGRVVDGGARVRARALLALARLGHPDFPVFAGGCLADRDPAVRLAAAKAIAHRGDRAGAGLLWMRLVAGDDVAEVWNECVRGLFVLAPDHGVRFARVALADERRDVLLPALGVAPHDDAIAVLEETLEAALGDERERVITAIGLSLRPKARAILLALVDGDRESDAEAALGALAIHRYDPRLVEDLRERTGRSRTLAQRFRALFEAG